MSSLPSYPAYKDSGETWLGEVPTSWDVYKIGHLSTVRRGASPRPIDEARYFDEDGEYAWTRIADVTASDVYLKESPQRLSALGSSLSVRLEPGELFLSIAATVGKPCITAIRACIHDGFVYFPELKVPNKFLFYIFSAGQAYKGLGKMGTQLNLNTDTVAKIKVGIGTPAEIAQIVAFLDYETARIDALIEKQQQLIALLKEKRQAVISHAVTKGLNPNAPLRDSGVEWLGMVPAHWEVSRIKFLVSHVIDCHHSTPQYDPEARWPALRTADVYPGRLDLEHVRRVHTNEYLERISRLKPEAGDIIYSREGERWGIAAPVPPGVELCLAQRVMLFRAGPSALPYFLMWALNSQAVYNQLAVNVVGATSPHVNIGEIREVWVAVPPLQEQRAIGERLEALLAKMDALDQQASALIEILQERRTALISAAVTGKIDVRNWTPESKPERDVA